LSMNTTSMRGRLLSLLFNRLMVMNDTICLVFRQKLLSQTSQKCPINRFAGYYCALYWDEGYTLLWHSERVFTEDHEVRPFAGFYAAGVSLGEEAVCAPDRVTADGVLSAQAIFREESTRGQTVLRAPGDRCMNTVEGIGFVYRGV